MDDASSAHFCADCPTLAPSFPPSPQREDASTPKSVIPLLQQKASSAEGSSYTALGCSPTSTGRTFSPLAILGFERLLEAGARSLAPLRLGKFGLGLQAAAAAATGGGDLFVPEQGPDHVQKLGEQFLDRFGQAARAYCRRESLFFADVRARELCGIKMRRQ